MAQDPAATPQQPQTAQNDPLKFNHDGEMLIVWSIKPERVTDFETGWRSIKQALAANQNADLRAFGESINVSRVQIPAGSPAAIYVFRLSPASKTYSYNHTVLLFETLKAPDPDPSAPAGSPNPPGTFTYDEAKQIYDKIDGSWTEQGGIVPWPLQKMNW